MYSSFPFTVAGLMLDRELDNHKKCTVTRNCFDRGLELFLFFTKWLNYNQWWSYKNVCSVINKKKTLAFP